MDFDMHSNLYNSAVCWYISRYFFFLSTVVCLSPPSNIQQSFKAREKEKRIFILFLFIYLWNFVHRLKIAPVVYYKRTPYIIIAQRKLIQLTATFVCETWQRNRERQKEKVCNQFLLSIFVWKIQCDRWRWLHRVWKQKQLSPWVSQWTPSTLILRKR